ncbi:MAG: arginine--tRNA ligase [Actinomycetota bacterium]|nr:arginine--tRNA ligase [Actinomycetota bacterium]
MIADKLRELLEEGLQGLRDDHVIADHVRPEIEITRPQRLDHGDFSTNLSLIAAKNANMPPRQFAESLLRRLPQSPLVIKAEVAGPGFINLFLDGSWLYETISSIRQQKGAFGRSAKPSGRKVQVEFVSANPNGPLHVGSGRNAALGDAIARLLAAAGDDVSREYYVNDTGTQIELFARSLEARYMQALGMQAAVPEGGYEGDYLIPLGKQLAEKEGMGLIGKIDQIAIWGVDMMLASHRGTLERLGIEFDSWFSEKTLHDDGKVDAAIERLRELDLAYEKEGAVWFAGTKIGASRDQVLVRSDEGASPTYLAKDIAYLIDKVERGFDKTLYVWGADHHGNVETLTKAAEALELQDVIEVELYQLVTFTSGGETARMRRRAGTIVDLDELIDEVGPDATRFTLVSRSSDIAFEFDLEQVKARSMENPVYYVQYQHARTCSILRYATEQAIAQVAPEATESLVRLTHESETFLMRKLSEFPEVVLEAAKLRAPHRVVHYCQALASLFSAFYRDCRVMSDDDELTQARLALTDATRQVLADSLDLIGVSAPEQM